MVRGYCQVAEDVEWGYAIAVLCRPDVAYLREEGCGAQHHEDASNAVSMWKFNLGGRGLRLQSCVGVSYEYQAVKARHTVQRKSVDDQVLRQQRREVVGGDTTKHKKYHLPPDVRRRLRHVLEFETH